MATATSNASSKQLIALSQGIDKRLLRFFQRYPPVLNPAAITTASSMTTSTDTPPGSTPDTATVSNTPTDAADTGTEAEPIPSLLPYQGPNPFLPYRFAATGIWHNPKYSLRRQADLMKLADKHGLADIMPPSQKSIKARLLRRLEGLKVKGTGVGEKVKGHWWERSLYKRLEQRRQAMLEMPNLIYKWKQLGHGRGWNKWPK